jgi:hypothetical protein
MKRFSDFVLESTLDLAMESMPPEQDPRVAACVKNLGETNAVFCGAIGRDPATGVATKWISRVRKRNFRVAQGFERAIRRARAGTVQPGKHTLTQAAGAPSEFGECWLRFAASGSHRRRPRRQAEGVENLSSHNWVFDGCQNAHPRAAVGTVQHI